MGVYRCPSNPTLATDGHPIVGCGLTFEQDDASRDFDPDHWVDCTHCGLGFDPDNPANADPSAEADGVSERSER